MNETDTNARQRFDTLTKLQAERDRLGRQNTVLRLMVLALSIAVIVRHVAGRLH